MRVAGTRGCGEIAGSGDARVRGNCGENEARVRGKLRGNEARVREKVRGKYGF